MMLSPGSRAQAGGPDRGPAPPDKAGAGQDGLRRGALGSIVLVVDDSPGTLGMLSTALETAGYRVLLAQSGAAALALVERVTPDIVLMDAVMPGMDGFEACRRLKGSRTNAGVPVVFMTGLTETEHVVRALDAGGVDYLTKPVVPAELLARVAVHLANARLTQSAHAALDTTGRFLLAIDRRGDLVWLTPQAGSWLGAGGADPHGGQQVPALPDEVVHWALACTVHIAPCKPISFAAPRTGTVVEVSYVGQISPDEILLRLVGLDQRADERTLRDRLGLTAREAEVLLWISRGKTNRDIAEILGLSPRTVNKHLEQIFAKVGVENRAAAASQVMRILHSV